MYFLFKALHVVGFVSWFAGLFYLVRMFVYYRESLDKSEPERRILSEQFMTMQKRVYKIICTPGMVITWIFGSAMLVSNVVNIDGWFADNTWMHSKLFLLILLTGYHHWCKGQIRRLEAGKSTLSPFQFRLLNELPSIFLVLIAMLAVYKNTINYAYLIGGILGFAVFLFLSAKAYKAYRERLESD